jgi:protocatechuate 3,4-dioxygenase beta subunit
MEAKMITRRKLIQNSMAVGLVFPTWQMLSSNGAAAALAQTPDCGSFPSPTPRQTAGPFFLRNSPERHDFSGDGSGAPMFIAGFVVDTACKPVAGAIVELWHADSDGNYDNGGYRFRGHVRSGDNGAYAFQTIRPGRYGSRTPHYHLKVFVEDRRVLTTQLYFPDAKSNARDGLYDPNLLMKFRGDDASARFDLIVPV